jgi:hypothetical protein
MIVWCGKFHDFGKDADYRLNLRQPAMRLERTGPSFPVSGTGDGACAIARQANRRTGEPLSRMRP